MKDGNDGYDAFEPKTNFFEELKRYFEETPKEKIESDWAKIEKFDKVEPTVEEFLEQRIMGVNVDTGYRPKQECEYIKEYGCIKDICSCNTNPKKAPFKHKIQSIPKEEILENRSNAYEFIDFDKQETLEEAAERIYPDNGFEDDLYCDEGKILREA